MSSSAIVFGQTDVSLQGAVGFKNRIINGNFYIWQRGTSQTSTGYGSDDRWQNENIGSTKTHSRQAFALGQTDVPGNPQYFSRTVVSSVAGSVNYVLKHQRIEGVKTFAGQIVTLSFWAKADSSKNICVEYNQVFGSGGSPSLTVSGISPTTCALTTAWKKFTITTTIPSVSGKTLGTNNDDCLYLAFWFDAGSSFNSRTNSLGQQSGTFDIAQVQLEAGTLATPFDDRPVGVELALCQRYYVRFIGNANSFFGIGQVASSTQVVGYVAFQVPMRAVPLGLETTSTASNYRVTNALTGAVNCTSLPAYNAANLTGATVLLTASALGGTSGFVSLIGTDGTGFLGFSSEL